MSSLSSYAEQLRRQVLEDGSVVLAVKVIPRAKTAEIVECMANGALKIKVTAVPENGKANQELGSVIAAFLDVAKRNVEVILGHTSQQKRVRVTS